ncbi:G-protein coupled receptor GRL101-like [Anneissia japonica]|uniref:G-protein coupled receptor GRL101-like n=1 Tax=Anneissia japonica TaxID=1529436 RepID=UPI001425A927|nr:G-protein coupled receptor GRL101-like [Anneissia japonica]
MSGVSSNPVDSVDKLLFVNLRIFRFLAILDISGNSIRAVKNTDFQQLVHLRTLCIQNNMITSLSGDIFKDLHNLKYLDIRGNGLKSIDLKTFAGLSNLEYLDISGNNIDEFDKTVFKDLASVKKLISDDYAFCCLLNEKKDVDCIPDADVFSSCANLMKKKVLRVFLWFFGLSALLGNMFVIVWRARNRPAVKSPSYIQSLLITNLAVADALMGVYMVIIASADVYYRDDYVIHDRYWKGSFICNFAGILAFLSSETSVFTLTAISCDRFLNIAFPFHRCHLTPKTVKCVVTASWTITLILSIIPALPSSYFNSEFYGVTSVCLALPLTSERVRGWEYTAAIFIGVNMLCFLLIFLSYSGIFILIKVSSAKLKKIGLGSMDSVKKQHIALAVRMVFIVATDFLCWVPIIIMGILSLTRRVDIPAEVYAWAAVFILPINSAINPFLYTIASLKKVRKQLKASKVISENISQTEKSTVNMVASNENEYQRKKRELSVVNKIEEIVNSTVVTGNNEVDDEIYEHLSKALHLAKQVQESSSKAQVKTSEQAVGVNSNHSSQADTLVKSDCAVKNSEQPVVVNSNDESDTQVKSDCVYNPVYDANS